MEKARLVRFILKAVVGIALMAMFSSCNWLLQKAQVRFNNQSSDTFTQIILGSIIVGALTQGSTTDYQLIDAGTYTLSTVSGAGAITWPTEVTVNQPDSYTITFFGTATNLGVDFKKD